MFGASLSIIISVIVLAAIDSINPVELLAAIFLFTLKKPLNSFFSYTSGIFFFHLILGYICYYAFDFILDLQIFNSPVFDRSLELIFGILLIILGLRMKKENRSTVKKISNPKPLYSFLLGIGITASAIPTSAAYYSALGLMHADKLNFGSVSFLLLLYNVIFVLPLFIMLIIYLCFRKKSEKIFEKIRVFILKRLNRLMRIIFVLAGAYLIINFILHINL